MLAATGFWALLCLGLLWPAFQALRSNYDETMLFWMMMALALGVGMQAARSQTFRNGALPMVSALGALLLVWWSFEVVGFAVTATENRHDRVTEREGHGARTERWRKISSSSLPDIYHIVVDEFQTDYFTRLLTRATREQLAGFRFYPRATTPYGRTELALSALFSGVPYDYKGEPVEYVSAAFSGRQSLLTQLKAFGYWSVGYVHTTHPRGAPSPFDETYFHPEIADLSQDNAADRLFLSLWLYATLPREVGRSLIPQHMWEQLETQTLLPDEAPVQSLQSFRKLMAAEARRPAHEGPRYVFAHLILPHFPLVLESDCTFRPGVTTTALAQSECTLRTLLQFVDTLRRHDRFRDTLILMHADHGARHFVRKGQLIRARAGSDSLEWSWGRARTLMLIKPAGATAEAPLLIDERPGDLYDLFPTILDNLEASSELQLAGCSLLGPPCPVRTRYYHFYDKADERTIVDGPLKRYKIAGDEITFDREIMIQR
ncbi:MAG: sulfatase-like hydrolase/transferase [Luteitalea sp.]|nr:sulfatase-like hydrolase/transferase [Luteitalea sp.]